MAKKRIPHSKEAITKVPSSEALTGGAAPAVEKKSHSTRARALKPPAADSALPKAAGKEASAYPRDRIARLAYSFWEQRGYQPGNAVEDWLRAERQILNGAVR